MKRTFLFLLSLLVSVSAFTQAPGSFSYQAVVRNSSGEPLTNADVIFFFSIIKTDAGGMVVYTEKHAVETNEFGLVNLAVGSGTDKTGDFAAIDWGGDNYFLNVKVDKGDAVFTDMGTSQLLSVPYAFNAAAVETVSGGFYYRDKDGDGFGYMYESVWVPDGTAPPAYYVNNSSDCNDDDFYMQDGSPEICDGIDNDCNGLVDEFWPELGDICFTGEGVCRSYGFIICDPGDPSGPPICNAVPGIPSGPETCNYMDDDCDGEVDNGFCDENGKYFTDNACGNCYTDCQAIYNLANAYGQCDNSGPAPVCIMICNPGYYDLDQIPQNGCEFHLQEDAVYVSAQGTDAAGCGTGFNEWGELNACRTINQGIGEAISQTKSKVLVANGIYNETVNMADGIDLLGGYDPVSWNRDPANSGTLLFGTDNINNHPVTIVASNIDQAEVSGFLVLGSDAAEPGYNSYAIYVKNCGSGLNILNNTILAGDAGDGEDGMNGVNGLNGISGGAGADAFDSYLIYGGDYCQIQSGGSAGILNLDSYSLQGGSGGSSPAACPFVYGAAAGSGFSGTGAGSLPGGAGGSGGYHAWVQIFTCQGYEMMGPMDGGNGQDGISGSDGSGGAGGTNVAGTVIASHWTGQQGADGVKGGDGSSAGGGGAGGSLMMHSSCFAVYSTTLIYAPTGGGGGSGAQGGSGGKGGTAGGASFGIIVIDGMIPAIEGNIFRLGNGGNGGNGAAGGFRGTGGAGGPGGTVSPDLTAALNNLSPGLAGRGGFGGDGGFGGGGGGATGGSSFGIYTFNCTGIPQYETKNIFSGGVPGKGGKGGYSAGNAGQDGLNGSAISCSYH